MLEDYKNQLPGQEALFVESYLMMRAPLLMFYLSNNKK
jgi:hypothetical protein